MLKRTVAVVALTAFAWALPPRAYAEFISANQLLQNCSAGELHFRAMCLGYVLAISDVMESETISGWKACVPNEVVSGQVRDIALAYLINHPEERHLAADSVVAKALSVSFPCR